MAGYLPKNRSPEGPLLILTWLDIRRSLFQIVNCIVPEIRHRSRCGHTFTLPGTLWVVCAGAPSCWRGHFWWWFLCSDVRQQVLFQDDLTIVAYIGAVDVCASTELNWAKFEMLHIDKKPSYLARIADRTASQHLWGSRVDPKAVA